MTFFLKIWERYFIRQFIRMLVLFLSCFYGLYILIDYASHGNTITGSQASGEWQGIARYYFYVFASRAEILLPIALLIAFIYTALSLNTQNELVALQSSGFPLKTLMRPFITAALIAVFLIYANEQFFLPTALRKLRRIEDAAKHQKKGQALDLAARHVILEDGSVVVYQDYDTNEERFFDAYWIQSIDSIYRMKYLTPIPLPPTGYFVDHLTRQSNGEIYQKTSYLELPLPEMKFNVNHLQSALIDPDILPLTALYRQSLDISSSPTEKESKILTAFYWKIIIPWLCLLAIIAPAPFCLRFSRAPPIFLIYVCSLFGMIAFYMLMDATQVVAKKQIFPPLWVIFVPFLLVFSYFGFRYKKLT